MILFLYFIKRNIDQIGAARKERQAVTLPKIMYDYVGTVYIIIFLMDKYLTKSIVDTYILFLSCIYIIKDIGYLKLSVYVICLAL